MRLIQFGVVALMVAGLASVAFAQESEFKDKMQEDLDGYKPQLESSCAFKGKVEWTGGKLGHNPRESEKPEWNSLSTLCTTALDTLSNTCVVNKPVRQIARGLKSIQCKRGKGTINFKREGGVLVFTVDARYVKNNAAGQGTDLAQALKTAFDN